ncbi:MAG: hypothetical protein GW760_01365 [Legionella sp.]|nr:hypothetical protein [Legionella sp.]
MVPDRNIIKPIPRRAKPVAEKGLDAGQVQLKQEMIAICQEMINLLAILTKKERAFDVFQQQLLAAAGKEGWPMTVPAETDVAEPASSSTAKAGGGAFLKTSSIPEEASFQTEVPSSSQEHLDMLHALDQKINKLKRYRTDLPDSVNNVLFGLQLRVQASIQAVDKEIAAGQREATLRVQPSVFAKQQRREPEETSDETGRLERRHSI